MQPVADPLEEERVRERYAALEASVRDELPGTTAPAPVLERIDAVLARAELLLNVQIDAMTEVTREPVTDRFFARMLRDADRLRTKAEHSTRIFVERIRAGELSRTRLATIARVVAAGISRADRLVEEARARGSQPALREYVELRSRLHEIGHAVLEMAERGGTD
ncbi:MAG: hypothetical protein ACKV2T_22170 [Kofleriaceae bacterium]